MAEPRVSRLALLASRRRTTIERATRGLHLSQLAPPWQLAVLQLLKLALQPQLARLLRALKVQRDGDLGLPFLFGLLLLRVAPGEPANKLKDIDKAIFAHVRLFHDHGNRALSHVRIESSDNLFELLGRDCPVAITVPSREGLDDLLHGGVLILVVRLRLAGLLEEGFDLANRGSLTCSKPFQLLPVYLPIAVIVCSSEEFPSYLLVESNGNPVLHKLVPVDPPSRCPILLLLGLLGRLAVPLRLAGLPLVVLGLLNSCNRLLLLYGFAQQHLLQAAVLGLAAMTADPAPEFCELQLAIPILVRAL
mmetsp:Transcript_124588/g.363765  ORF Transcript_124588/g.363765 Transcript_124588/m.363765 type:complete len:306 (+) Transcript_124588:479-1396(+)